MKSTVAKVLILFARIGFTLALLLGGCIFFGVNVPLGLHMLAGSMLLFALLLLSLISLGRLPVLALAGIALVLITPSCGMMQLQPDVHNPHLLQIFHLLAAIISAGVAEIMAKRLRIERR